MTLSLLIRRLTGFKPLRWTQWRMVAEIEMANLSLKDKVAMLWYMVKQAINLSLNRQLWRLKMRRCHKCPIYDPSLKRCRPYHGSNLGCGCYMPFAAIVKKHGWATDQALQGNHIPVHCW